MKTATIRQTVKFKASPHEVYESLMDSKKHSGFTGEDAKISRKVGGKFSAYGRYITGKNLKLIADRKIVQKWRGSDWPQGHCSTVTFTLKKIPGGTELMFLQTEVPEEFLMDISDGWTEFYWKNRKKCLKNDLVCFPQ